MQVMTMSARKKIRYSIYKKDKSPKKKDKLLEYFLINKNVLRLDNLLSSKI